MPFCYCIQIRLGFSKICIRGLDEWMNNFIVDCVYIFQKHMVHRCLNLNKNVWELYIKMNKYFHLKTTNIFLKTHSRLMGISFGCKLVLFVIHYSYQLVFTSHCYVYSMRLCIFVWLTNLRELAPLLMAVLSQGDVTVPEQQRRHCFCFQPKSTNAVVAFVYW